MQPWVGEIRMFAGNFTPVGWELCNGQSLSISENEVLFQLIGTTYGGDGQETFNLPDLRGRVPIHHDTRPGARFPSIGEMSGTETVTLTTSQLPGHTHALVTHGGGATHSSATGRAPAESVKRVYRTPTTVTPMTPTGPSGGSQTHENMAPFLGVSFIIALFGLFPVQS